MANGQEAGVRISGCWGFSGHASDAASGIPRGERGTSERCWIESAPIRAPARRFSLMKSGTGAPNRVPGTDRLRGQRRRRGPANGARFPVAWCALARRGKSGRSRCRGRRPWAASAQDADSDRSSGTITGEGVGSRDGSYDEAGTSCAWERLICLKSAVSVSGRVAPPRCGQAGVRTLSLEPADHPTNAIPIPDMICHELRYESFRTTHACGSSPAIGRLRPRKRTACWRG